MRILIVDDEPDIGKFISDVAIDMGHDALAIHSTDAFEETYARGFDVLILDLVMPGRDGIELLRFLALQHASLSIILISGYDSGVLHSAQKLAAEHGLNIIATLTKPFIHEGLEALLGKISLTYGNPQTDALAQAESPCTEDFKRAIRAGELETYFQPQLNIVSGKLAGVEALVRWNHPQWGLLLPQIIIPLAEQAGLMRELTTLVIEQSFRLAQTRLKKGIKLHVSINMPADNLSELGFPDWICAKIEEYGLLSEQVALEVTESGLMQDLVKSLDVLTRLRMKNVALSIDDFGTGYSSMVQLYRIPFSEMKIDKSFVIQATTDAEALAIVKMTTLLGHELGMTVVAEGVEDEETWNIMSELGCDVVQGFLIAEPMRAEPLIEWVQSRV